DLKRNTPSQQLRSGAVGWINISSRAWPAPAICTNQSRFTSYEPSPRLPDANPNPMRAPGRRSCMTAEATASTWLRLRRWCFDLSEGSASGCWIALIASGSDRPFILDGRMSRLHHRVGACPSDCALVCFDGGLGTPFPVLGG